MYKKINKLNIEKAERDKVLMFSSMMLFFIACAVLKSFWEMIFILIIVFLSTIYEFINHQKMKYNS